MNEYVVEVEVNGIVEIDASSSCDEVVYHLLLKMDTTQIAELEHLLTWIKKKEVENG